MRLTAELSDRWGRWLWACPLLALALAAGVLMFWGFTLWTAIVVALLLVCPALILWGALYLGRAGK
jgi:hypothetical protein